MCATEIYQLDEERTNMAASVARTPRSHVEFSRCDDHPWLAVEKQNVNHKAERADVSIAQKVNHAIWGRDALRSTNYAEIQVDVKDHMVFLSGYVGSTTNKQRAEDAARTVPGVLIVKSHLVPDDKIIREVAGALGKIEHKFGVKFFTSVRNGVVGLHGEVGSAAVRNLAENYAANIPGVRGVINAIRAPGVDLGAEDQRFLQPVIGEPIYFRDGLSGRVQSVIINPNNRRVIAMLVRWKYSNSQQDPRFMAHGEGQPAFRLIVVPTSVIRYLTKTSGFLHIDGNEAAKYPDFDPSGFVAPRDDWTPPFPYCPAEVLFPVEFVEEIILPEH